MHKWAKSIMDCVKSKIDSMGMDNLDRENVEEFKDWVCIAEKVAEYDYYYHITEAMSKPENEYGVNYDENGRFYTPMRNSNGKFMKRGYEPNMMEHERDMDYDRGYMYYSGSNGGSVPRQSRYDMARRGYEESKEMNPDNDTKNMEKMEEIFRVLESDMQKLKPLMSTTEKNFARNKFTTMSNAMM